MTPERARELVVEQGCRLKASQSSCLVVINEALKFKYTLALSDLPDFSEEAFIATITTGRSPSGQPALPGIYQDYHPGSSTEQAWPKEITIATTYKERAEWMEKNLIGHTMSGERLEQRPMVQHTDAEDFLATPLKLYDILAIRLSPSVEYPRMIDVIATYQPHIFYCAICGAESSKIPDELWTLRGYKRYAWCGDACERQIRARLRSEVEDFRREVFGDDPVGVALAIQCASPFERLINGVVYCKGLPNNEVRKGDNQL